MSQTPTKGPFARYGDTILGKGGVALCTIYHTPKGGEKEANFAIIDEALNIHHESKQTPRRILDLLNLYREKRANDGMNMRQWDSSKHFYADAEIECREKALTLAKEGGPK